MNYAWFWSFLVLGMEEWFGETLGETIRYS
jgi:hypothetical protein